MNRKKVRGSVAVEMAFLIIPLIVLAFGIAEFGRAMYEYNTLTKSVRGAVRHLSQSVPSAELQAEAVKLAVYGTVIGTTSTPLLPNLSESNVAITSVVAPTGVTMATVTITGYTFDFIFNPLVFFGNTTTNITFDDIHATMQQT